MTPLPRFFRLRQTFDRPRVDDVASEVERQLAGLDLGASIETGHRVAITAGSRGIANVDHILAATVAHLRRLGAEPFIVPAMGSHGGATAEGQTAVLAGYGIREAQIGCPVRSAMETVVVGRTAEGFDVHFDKLAHEADHVLVCGRVKPHTMFGGPVQSGLLKMLLIGLGKAAGATVYHNAIRDFGFASVIESAAPLVLERCNVLAGLAIVENAYDETARIEGVRPADFRAREEALLALAIDWLPRLPFEEADLLLLDWIGKDISGIGLDTNIVGRKYNDNASTDRDAARVRRIVARGLTAGSHGNAIGVGVCDFVTRRLAEAIDWQAVRTNALVAGHLGAAKMPLVYDTDREMLDAALPTIGLTPPEQARVQWIRHTLDLAEVECSAAYLAEAEERSDLEVIAAPRPLPFDAEGNLAGLQEEMS